MKPPPHRLPGQRLGGALALLLIVLLALSTALSLTRSRQLDQQLSDFELGALPTLRLLHGLASGVEELRGMAALHLLLSGTAEITALEAQMQDRRQQLGLRLVACASRLKDGSDHQHFDAVQASLARFWVEQDRLAALSRQAAADPVAAAAARALLAGPALQAFQQLAADIEAWGRDAETQANQQAQQAHTDATSTAWQLLGLVAVALLAAAGCGGWLRAAGIAAARAGTGPATAPAAAVADAGSTTGSPAATARAAITQAQARAPTPTTSAGQPAATADCSHGARANHDAAD